MDPTERDAANRFFIRAIFWLPFRKRFTREEYVNLFRLLRQETSVLRRRPTYLLGLLVSGGLCFYFLISGLAATPNDWKAVGLGMLILFGYACGVNSTREYLCERLLRIEQGKDAADCI
jgi:hypothetical protein